MPKFRSAPPCGGRPRPVRRHEGLGRVSIRAPVRGATPTVWSGSSAPCCFDPRPRAGGDGPSVLIRRSALFRSAPPCGGRRVVGWRRQRLMEFRSAPPCGGRRSTATLLSCLKRFRSAPPCGGRPLVQKPRGAKTNFIGARESRSAASVAPLGKGELGSKKPDLQYQRPPAKAPRTSRTLPFRGRLRTFPPPAASCDQWHIEIQRRFCPDMLDPTRTRLAQKIEPQAVA